MDAPSTNLVTSPSPLLLSKDSLHNSLLVADPSLTDGVFDRTVIHIAEHSADGGATGYIINKPTGNTVGEILEGEQFTDLRSVPIYFGGPVRTDQIIFSAYWWNSEGDFQYRLRISAEEAKSMKAKSGCLIMAHVGHAAWEPSQLEQELDEQAWVNLAVSSETISTSPSLLWQTLLSDFSPYHHLLSMSPKDIRIN